MFAKLTSSIAAAVVAASTMFAVPASAANFSAEIVISPAHQYRGAPPSRHWDNRGRHGRDDDRRWGGGRHYRADCSPHEAVRKANWRGMRHAGVRRVTWRSIEVAGWNRGHRALIVFDRDSRNCRVIASRGI